MKSVASLPSAEAAGLAGVLFDLDDTVLTHGLLTRRAYGALCDLHDAGLTLIAVTGRPSGWGEVLARQWPVAGCITENGAVSFVREGAGVSRREDCAAIERDGRRARLALLAERVRQAVPEARLTDDNDLRRSDMTWDVGERVTLPDERARLIIAEIQRAGARWSQSSVHLHATYDRDDKASGSVAFCSGALGVDPAVALVRYAFVGDSGNDAACFAAFRTTFGVANVRRSLGRLTVPPRYVADAAMGEGFAEIAAAILDRRPSA